MFRRPSVVCAALALAACRDEPPPRVVPPPPEAPPRPARRASSGANPAPEPSGPARWIAIGGAGLPVEYQVSIEQDVAQAARALPGDGIVLFAGGPGSRVVQVDDPAAKGDPLLLELADLFAPRGGRGSHYREPEIAVHGPATAVEIDARLRAQLGQAGPPLIVYFAGHGAGGATPADATLALWEQGALSVADLAAAIDGGVRPVRLVVTSCFSGGFAELVFAGGKQANGSADGDRCGLYASTWDLPAAGCDPNPDRQAQHGYGLHFLAALRGQDRAGKSLASALDLDGDGKISLLEAHTRVRIAAGSVSVPTTTSERWLRHAAPARGRIALRLDPEQRAVIEALGPAHGVSDLSAGGLERAERDLSVRRAAVERQIDDIEARLEDARKQEETAFRRAAAAVLARWPVLDDPWHPRFLPLVVAEREAIASFLDQSTEYAEYRGATDVVAELDGQVWTLREQIAPVDNLHRAVQTVLLASRLAARGGPALARYERLLACERTVP